MTYGSGLGLGFESTVVLLLGRTTEGGGRRGTECDKKRKKESDGKLHGCSVGWFAFAFSIDSSLRL